MSDFSQIGGSGSSPLFVEPVTSLAEFLGMSRWEVERTAESLRAKSTIGATWVGLSNLMERRGYHVVRDLGQDAARAWAAHLGVVQRDSPRTQFPERADFD